MSSSAHSIFSSIERTAILVSGATAFVLGVIGYHQYFITNNQAATYSDLAYLSVNLFFIQFEAKGNLPILLDIARWLAPATLSYALVKTLLGLMQNHLQKIRLKYFKHHAVVIGIDEHSVKVAISFREKGIATIAVDIDEQNEFWGELKKSGVHTYVGNPSDKTLLAAINIKHAAYLFASTQSDATNLEIIYDTQRVKQGDKHHVLLESVCQIHNRSLRYTLYNRPLFATNHPSHNTRLVDYKAIAARWLLNEFGPHKLVKDFSQLTSLKIFVQGDDRLLINLVQRVASWGIYANPDSLHIVILGTQATSIYQELINQTPAISELIKLEPVSINGYDTSNFKAILRKHQPNIIYVCERETDQTLMAIQTLEDDSFDGQVVVCENESQSTFAWLKEEFSHNQLIKFAEINSVTCHYDNVFENSLDSLAMAIHNDYVKQQLAKGDSPEKNTSLVEWNLLPEILKDANRNQADHILIKSKYLSDSDTPSSNDIEQALTKENTLALAKMEHRRWLAEKKLAGWRHTSGEKDAVKKLSPSLIEWDELSENDKQKDIATIEQLPKLVKLTNKK